MCDEWIEQETGEFEDFVFFFWAVPGAQYDDAKSGPVGTHGDRQITLNPSWNCRYPQV
jgi:hypothetical protein